MGKPTTDEGGSVIKSADFHNFLSKNDGGPRFGVEAAQPMYFLEKYIKYLFLALFTLFMRFKVLSIVKKYAFFEMKIQSKFNIKGKKYQNGSNS